MSRLVLRLTVALVFLSVPHRSHGAEPDAEALLHAKPVVEEGAGIARLQQEKYNAALRELQARAALRRGGKGSLVDLISAANRLLESELDTSKKRLLVHFRFAQGLEREVFEKVQGGIDNTAALELARYHRLDLEIRLLDE